MFETCSETSKYPWVTIWGTGMTYFGHSGEKYGKSQKMGSFGVGKKNPKSSKNIF